jgi:hypothetical protein
MATLYGEKTISYAPRWYMPHGVIHNGMSPEWSGGNLVFSPSKRDLHTQGRRKPMEHEIFEAKWWTMRGLDHRHVLSEGKRLGRADENMLPYDERNGC